jgi:hypothetical protein
LSPGGAEPVADAAPAKGKATKSPAKAPRGRDSSRVESYLRMRVRVESHPAMG